jgi:hypothetical protein
MRQLHATRSPVAAPRSAYTSPSVGRQMARFAVHVLQMCAVMCISVVLLGLLVAGAAAVFGFSDPRQSAPVLSAVVVTLTLAGAMVAWMRFMAMGWQPTLEIVRSDGACRRGDDRRLRRGRRSRQSAHDGSVLSGVCAHDCRHAAPLPALRVAPGAPRPRHLTDGSNTTEAVPEMKSSSGHHRSAPAHLERGRWRAGRAGPGSAVLGSRCQRCQHLRELACLGQGEQLREALANE